MTKDIVEAGQPMATAAAVIEKKARQLVYDARYEVKGKLQGKKVDPVVMERMVLQQISKSKGIPAVIARAKQMVSKKASVKEEYISEIQESATNSVANALYKVFVEGVQKEEIHLNYLEELAASPDKKYKIRVTDPKTGNSYVRFATREKITELRGKGLKVELTEYGDPREGERKRGEDTARATGGGRRSKKDYDGDGKIESPAKEHAGAVHNAIQRRRGLPADGKDTSSVKEDFLADAVAGTRDQNTQQITGKNVDNSKLIKVFPQDGSEPTGSSGTIQAGVELDGPFLTEKAKSKAQQAFMGMVYARKKGKMKKGEASPEVEAAAKSITKKEAKKFAKTKHKGLPEKVKVKEEVENRDTRADKAYREVIKNKFRSLGAKNPLVMSDTEDMGKAYSKIATSDMVKGRDDEMCEAVAGVESTSSDFRTGTTKPPAAPVLPKPTSTAKPKPQPRVGHGTPGYKYGALESYKSKGEVVEQHRPPAGWKPYGGGPDDKPTVKLPLSGVMQGGWRKEKKDPEQASSKKTENKTA